MFSSRSSSSSSRGARFGVRGRVRRPRRVINGVPLLVLFAAASAALVVRGANAQAGDWTPAICGGASRASDHCATAMASWEKDVRALQARSYLHWSPYDPVRVVNADP